MGPGSRIFFNFCDFCFSWTMDHALSIFDNFDCQGHNSLNFGPIFKIHVPKHKAFQDLSFSFTVHPRGTCQRGQKRVLKLVHENKNHKN